MQLPDWTNMTFYNYLALGGAALAVLAVLAYFIPVTRIKIPAVIAGTLSGLAAGLGCGVLLMGLYGYKMPADSSANAAGPGDNTAPGVPPMGMGMGRGGPPGMGGGMPGMGGGMPGMGGQRGPNYKAQLTNLVAKLDLLTRKPITLTLNDAQKAKLQEQLAGLEDKEELTADEAQQRVETLQEALKNQRETLEAVGYRWSEQGGGRAGGGGGRPGGGQAPPNPFKEEQDGQRLKAVREQLTKAKGG